MLDFSIRLRAAAVVLLLGATTAHATNYTVGGDAACGYTTLTAAITAAAAQTSGSRAKIYVATNMAYGGQALSFNGFSFSLIGGVPDCSHLTPTGKTTISGNGSASVIAITDTNTGHAAILSHLTISGGGGSSGGGVRYSGASELSIDNSLITDNGATDGGGIRFIGTGSARNDLYLNANTTIMTNSAAHSGGGIRVDGNAWLHVDADQIWIVQNEAGDYGGGIALVGSSQAHIGSPGYFFGQYIGVLYQNTANYGGGIGSVATSGGAPSVELYPTDANHPVRIEQNRAHATGGGIYLGAYESNDGGGAAWVNAGGLQVDSNAAQEGAALYADTDSSTLYTGGGRFVFKPGYCATGIVCNSVSNNRAVTDADVPTAGSAILIQSEGTFGAQQIVMRGNEGAHLIRVADSLDQPLLLGSCLLTGNTLTAELGTFGSAAATIDSCTIADNTIGGAAVLRAQTGFALTDSIVAQGALPTLAYSGSGAGLTLEYLMLAHDAPALPASAEHIAYDDPLFVDAAHGDYHLTAHSPAIDVAPPVTGDDRDLDNRPRDQDQPGIADLWGDRDLGAYERPIGACYVGDTVYCDGFDP